MACSKGQLPRATCPPNGRELTTIEEKTLEDWILSLDARRLPPRGASPGIIVLHNRD